MKENLQLNKTKKNKTKSVLIIIEIVILSFLLVGIVSINLLIKILGKGIDEIKGKNDDYEKKEQTREDIYDSIPKELLNRNLISENLKYVDYEYGWSYELYDKTQKYYFYIGNDIYDKYKNYWLEGVDKSEYRDKYNEGLATYGDYVFKAIYINDLSYKSDVQYGNVHLMANKTYYLVQIYDEAIYYKYISSVTIKDETKYHIYSSSNCKEDSISKEYIFYQENNKWKIEELVR